MNPNKEKIISVISEVLGVENSKITMELGIGGIPEWDSLAHLRIINSLEEKFNISLDVEQILEIEDVNDIIDILNENN